MDIFLDYSVLQGWLNKGGPLMYLLLFASIVTVTLGLERTFHYLRAGRNKSCARKIHALIEKGNYDEAQALADDSTGPVAAVLAEGIRHREGDRALLEESVSFRGAVELQRLNKRLHVIELIGRLAPLVGLLGTVMGMVKAFQKVAGAQGAVDPALLAGGIWEALISTVAGLCVAIPAMIIHHFLEDRVGALAYMMKHYGTEAVKHLGQRA